MRSSADYRIGITTVIERHLLETKRTKKQLAAEVFQTQWTATLWRRMYSRVEWTLAELEAVAAWFDMTLLDFLGEVLYFMPLDNESNRVVR